MGNLLSVNKGNDIASTHIDPATESFRNVQILLNQIEIDLNLK